MAGKSTDAYSIIPKISGKIYDITGRSLYAEPLEINTNHYEIDLSRFNNGIYLLEITVNNQKIIKKISVIK